jgi:hypothetical protein
MLVDTDMKHAAHSLCVLRAPPPIYYSSQETDEYRDTDPAIVLCGFRFTLLHISPTDMSWHYMVGERKGGGGNLEDAGSSVRFSQAPVVAPNTG